MMYVRNNNYVEFHPGKRRAYVVNTRTVSCLVLEYMGKTAGDTMRLTVEKQ